MSRQKGWISSLTIMMNVDFHGSQDILNNLESPGTAELDEDDLMLDVDLPEDGLHGQYTGWRLQPLITAHLPLRDECFRLDDCRSPIYIPPADNFSERMLLAITNDAYRLCDICLTITPII